MVCLWFPRGSWMAALKVMLMALSPPLALARDTPADFLVQFKAECHFSNGKERVQYLERYIYNGQEIVRFDSVLGEHIAVTELGRTDTVHWNTLKDHLKDQRAAVDWLCRYNYDWADGFLVHRQTAPTVTVSSAKIQRLQPHHLLVCSVNGFYPGHIEVRWLRDGREEQAGVVSTGLIRNGDWTFQMLVMLETVPRSGEVYTCQVQHPSSSSPISVEWRAQSRSARSKVQSGAALNKMLSGAGGFVLGLLFLGAGLLISFRAQKGHSGLQPTGS